MEIRKDAPILPGEGLGGVAVGVPIISLADVVLDGRMKGMIDWSLNLFEASYYLREPAVEIVVDVRNGKVSRLTAKTGYVGTLSNGIGVGMRVSDALRIEPRLYYDEAEELIFCREVPGLALEVAEIDPIPTAVPEMSLCAISVYVADIETAAGQRGMW